MLCDWQQYSVFHRHNFIKFNISNKFLTFYMFYKRQLVELLNLFIVKTAIYVNKKKIVGCISPFFLSPKSKYIIVILLPF